MRVLPILFNTEMVRAILDGRKTVTRRICKDGDDYTVPDMGFYSADRRTYVAHSYADKRHKDKLSLVERPCPIYPGDILYVRETWTYHENAEGGIIFKARCPEKLAKTKKWHPSIHMPKEATRIWLKVTDVRVERLKDITEEQAMKEGFSGIRCGCGGTAYACTDCYNTGWIEPPFVGFMYTWNSTIKKADLDRYGWDANPWVWVIEFSRCERPDENEFAGSSEWKDNFMQRFCKVN